MAVTLQTEDAIVLRTLRYGESDLIAHLYTREGGRRNVIAKGARKARSRLGVRMEPFMVVAATLRQGRGDLALVQSVEPVAAHDSLRGSWTLQHAAAGALDMLGRLSVEDAANEQAFHLTTNMLRLLDGLHPPDPEALRERSAALVVAYQLKLLHVTGLAPHLASCARCGEGNGDLLRAWSPPDGGVVCAACREPADVALEQSVRGAAAWSMQRPLAALATAEVLPEALDLRAVSRRIVIPMCAEHAGFRPRALQ